VTSNACVGRLWHHIAWRMKLLCRGQEEREHRGMIKLADVGDRVVGFLPTYMQLIMQHSYYGSPRWRKLGNRKLCRGILIQVPRCQFPRRCHAVSEGTPGDSRKIFFQHTNGLFGPLYDLALHSAGEAPGDC
jgi:hypothetical protein